MRIIILTILATLTVVALVAATTRITASQIIGSPTVGQVLTTTAAGVAGWVTPVSPATIPSFADAEVPSGTINGTNATFTLAHGSANTGNSLVLTRNGVVQQSGGNDYTLAGSTITFTSGSVPLTGDTLQAWYRY